MAGVTPRSMTPLMNRVRDFFSQRKIKNPLRWEQLCSPRTQPPPTLPEGPSHRLSANYYHTRDGRRDCKVPTLAYQAGQKAIEAGTEGTEQKVATRIPPGFGYKWTETHTIRQ